MCARFLAGVAWGDPFFLEGPCAGGVGADVSYALDHARDHALDYPGAFLSGPPVERREYSPSQLGHAVAFRGDVAVLRVRRLRWESFHLVARANSG